MNMKAQFFEASKLDIFFITTLQKDKPSRLLSYLINVYADEFKETF